MRTIVWIRGCLLGCIFVVALASAARAQSCSSVTSSTLDPSVCLKSAPPGWCGGATDLGAAMNNAMSCLSDNYGGGTVSITPGVYTVSTQIELVDDILINGAGGSQQVALQTSGTGFGARALITGSVENVTIQHLSIVNPTGVATTNLGQDGIDCSACENFTVRNVFVSAAGYGILTGNSEQVHIENNYVVNVGFGGIMTLGTSDDIWITHNTVSDCLNVDTSMDSANCYGISLSGLNATYPTSNTTNGWVTGNDVSYVNDWECYDSHGGSNQVFENNSCSYAYVGIMAGATATQPLTHVVVRGNHITNGTTHQVTGFHGSGIVLGGIGPTSLVSDAYIGENYVSGYGSEGNSGNVGAIQLQGTYGARVLNNACPSFYQACITLMGYNLNSTINSNVAGSVIAANPGAAMAAAAISIVTDGTWGAHIDDNTAESGSLCSPVYLLYDVYQGTQFDFGPRNRMVVPTQTSIQGSSPGMGTCNTSGANPQTTSFVSPPAPSLGNPVFFTTASPPTNGSPPYFGYAPGQVSYDQYYRPQHYFSGPSAAFPTGGTGYYNTNKMPSTTGVGYGVATSIDTISQIYSGPYGLSTLPVLIPMFTSGCTSNCSITGVQVMSPGAGATTQYLLTLASTGGGSGAAFGTQTFDASGDLLTVPVTSPGSGYAPSTTTILVSEGTNWAYDLPEGMNIGIATSTGVFNARVVQNNGATLTVDKTPTGALTGVGSAIFSSLTGSITGSVGDTCKLTFAGGATGTVVLNTANNIIAGTAIQITSPGTYSTPPTTATLTNGIGATCTGASATVSSSLTGVVMTWQNGSIN